MFNEVQVAITNVKEMIDVIAGELVWSVEDQRSAYGGKERFKLV